MSSDTKIIVQEGPTAEDIRLYKKRLFETADRSYINDRLNVELPEGLYGEWIGTDDFSQYHATSKGFVDGSEYLKAHNKIHDTPLGSTIGDVKFMVIPKWKYEAQQQVSAFEAARRSGLDQSRIDEFKSLAQELELGVDDHSVSTTVLSGTELQAKLNR